MERHSVWIAQLCSLSAMSSLEFCPFKKYILIHLISSFLLIQSGPQGGLHKIMWHSNTVVAPTPSGTCCCSGLGCLPFPLHSKFVDMPLPKDRDMGKVWSEQQGGNRRQGNGQAFTCSSTFLSKSATSQSIFA